MLLSCRQVSTIASDKGILKNCITKVPVNRHSLQCIKIMRQMMLKTVLSTDDGDAAIAVAVEEARAEYGTVISRGDRN